MTHDRGDAAGLLAESSRGNRVLTARLGALVYDELRLRARRLLSPRRGPAYIQPTELVHDVFVKLMDGAEVDWQGRTHFLAVASRQLRHVLVDHVRAERASKRGGDVRLTTVGSQIADPGVRDAVDVLALDEALRRLERQNARRSAIVVLRLFGGLTVEEVARHLGISETAVKNHWRIAKARLLADLDVPGKDAEDPP
jgi:RNA polymerase sigma factor (TIGR02999 family)